MPALCWRAPCCCPPCPGAAPPSWTRREAPGAESAASSEQTQSTEDKTDLTEKVSLKINYAAGNKSRTITYNQESPLTLPDGTVYTAGMLKPMWDYVETALNCELTDITTQDQKATEMIDIASTTNFSGPTFLAVTLLLTI